MIKIGVVRKYNDKYGIIESEQKIIDFSKKDISNNEIIKVNDLVEFRLEEKFPNILFARNIRVINDDSLEEIEII